MSFVGNSSRDWQCGSGIDNLVDCLGEFWFRVCEISQLSSLYGVSGEFWRDMELLKCI